MKNPITARRVLAASATLGLLTVAACGSPQAPAGGNTSTSKPATSNTSDTSKAPSGGDDKCAAFAAYGDLKGKTVSVYTSIASDEEAKPHIDSFKPFEECTGATVKYEGSREFEQQLPIRVKAGNAPDVAYIPQPGLLATLVQQNSGKVMEAGPDASKNLDEFYNKAWRAYGTVDGKLYGVPVGANAKSFVWYSPKAFAQKGYQVPKTWDELMKLTDKIATDNPGAKPWCAGFESGGASGWVGTDWIEDMMLRTGSEEDYDKWVKHEIPFNDPKVVTAFEQAGSILKNDKYVNGGLGGVKTIATSPWTDAGFGVLDQQCFLHRQASFYQANWQKADPDATVGEDGDVFAFYLPGKTEDTKPLLGGGEFAVAFRDAPEVKALQAYLTSPEWSNAKAKATPKGGWVSANRKLDPANLTQPIDKLAFQLLSDEKTVFRFDASDLMPGAIGANAFWKGMVDWVASGKTSQQVTDQVEAAWKNVKK